MNNKEAIECLQPVADNTTLSRYGAALTAAIYALHMMEEGAVPVVRCRDCKHYELGVCLKIYSDGNVNADAWQERKPDDFCSYGERRADNG